MFLLVGIFAAQAENSRAATDFAASDCVFQISSLHIVVLSSIRSGISSSIIIAFQICDDDEDNPEKCDDVINISNLNRSIKSEFCFLPDAKDGEEKQNKQEDVFSVLHASAVRARYRANARIEERISFASAEVDANRQTHTSPSAITGTAMIVCLSWCPS